MTYKKMLITAALAGIAIIAGVSVTSASTDDEYCYSSRAQYMMQCYPQYYGNSQHNGPYYHNGYHHMYNHMYNQNGSGCYGPYANNETDENDVSPSVIIVSVDQNNRKDVIDRICRKFNMEIVYDYKNFSMYALKTKSQLSSEQMDYLTRDIASEEGVLGAERDRTAHIE